MECVWRREKGDHEGEGDSGDEEEEERGMQRRRQGTIVKGGEGRVVRPQRTVEGCSVDEGTGVERKKEGESVARCGEGEGEGRSSEP